MTKDQECVGEKTALAKRAKEDFYFAVKDRELIEEMKAEFQRVGAAVPPSAGSFLRSMFCQR